MAARIEAVDAGAVKAVMVRFCNDHCHAMAAMGPIFEMQDYSWFRRRTYSLTYILWVVMDITIYLYYEFNVILFALHFSMLLFPKWTECN